MIGTIQSISKKVTESEDPYTSSDEETILGSEVECKYHANTLNNRGVMEGGKFTQSSYIITTGDMDFTAETILLKNSKGVEVCRKRVQSSEVLESVQRVKITV